MRGEAWLVLAALAVEACVGYPQGLFDRIRHPVVWMGALISTLERRWNRLTFSAGARRALGVAVILIVLSIAIVLGFSIERLSSVHAGGGVVLVLMATSGLAQRSLYVHVREVDRALAAHDLAEARVLVARIVGRDTANLSTLEVSAAAVESLAESFNDAVVAPTFWLLIGGLPGLFAYKAINTADSMIGHIEDRWRAFGWAAARTDDLAESCSREDCCAAARHCGSTRLARHAARCAQACVAERRLAGGSDGRWPQCSAGRPGFL